MKNKDIILQNVGSVELFKENRQNLHPVRTLEATNITIPEEYFEEGINFHSVDKRIFEWFDFNLGQSPAVSFQQYIVENDILNGREKQYPSSINEDLSHVMSQGEFLSFIKKEELYQEYNLVQIAQITGFPGFSTIHLSSYGGNDIFLSRKKTGELCWVAFDITEEELYEHSADHYVLRLYDFEPNFGMPCYYVNLKPREVLFSKKIK